MQWCWTRVETFWKPTERVSLPRGKHGRTDDGRADVTVVVGAHPSNAWGLDHCLGTAGCSCGELEVLGWLLCRHVAELAMHASGNALVVGRGSAQQTARGGQGDTAISMPSPARSQTGFSGKCSRHGASAAALIGQAPVPGHEVGMAAGESEASKPVNGVRDRACMWSFGPSAVEDRATSTRVLADPPGSPSPTNATTIWWRRWRCQALSSLVRFFPERNKRVQSP